MIDTETKLFGGYRMAIRTFWIKGRDLVVTRLWERKWKQSGARFSTSIKGKAVSEDSVCMIGEEDRETKEFDLTIKSDETAKREWEWLKAIEGKIDGTTPELQLKGRISEKFDETPPTATLVFLYFGGKDSWSVECAIPPPVLAQLEAEVLAQRASDVYIDIEWVGGKVREGLHISWGLFTINDSPEPLRGYVESIGWRVSDPSLMLDEPMPADGEPH